jgi:uncharacterized protein (TIGR03435 family)
MNITSKFSTFVLLILLGGTQVSAQATLNSNSNDTRPPGPVIGAAAPALEFEHLLQAPVGAKTDWASLKDKVVVLEFWATWCAPCIKVMPHLNDLAAKYKDKPVQFISITDEDVETVKEFMPKRAINAWIALDTDRSVLKSYGVMGIPQTFVIDRAGKIAAHPRAEKVNEKMLDTLLAGKPLPAAEAPKLPTIPLANAASADQPLFSFTISPSKKASSAAMRGPTVMSGQSINLKQLIRMIYNLPSEERVIVPAAQSEEKYDVNASAPKSKPQEFYRLLAQLVEASLNLKIKREAREIEVFVLAPITGHTPTIKTKPSSSRHVSSDAGVLSGSGVSLSSLTGQLEGLLKLPVVDETKLSETYQWTLLFDPSNHESVIEAVRKELGLELKRATRQVEVVTVEK